MTTPEISDNHGYTLSGANTFCAHSVTRHRPMTDAVCINEIATPTAIAWRARPAVPTRYAAITVLPCPGPSA
jgi:hypothetical protein